MPEDDELERLRRADPVAKGSLPSADSPPARALFEEIAMTDPKSTHLPAADTAGRRRLVAGIAAALVLVGGGAAATALRGGEPAPRDPSGAVTEPVAPISPGGSSLASCVESYDLSTLANREMAFDGTVERVDGDSITFIVNRAYRGAADERVTLKGASTLGGPTSAGRSVRLEKGTRLLVAGDGGFAWSCDFTQPYDPEVAAEWESTFAG